jgi:RNA polymerase sigma factor (sigma-70 family)
MSPLTLRRYRAERLLREEFEALRGRVLDRVRGRLWASGAPVDAADLDACYALAWQGLYTALLAGEEVGNPAGWLVVVTFRRAIDEHRARLRTGPACDRDGAPVIGSGPEEGSSQDRDIAAELDDRVRLRQLLQGLRGRLSAREREAAVLCYLQGMSRSQAAEQMGVSETRMRKLMEGRSAGQAGVAGKFAALVETIRGGGWCEEQASSMRALAYGILDPGGERYRLAVMHRSECPACRAYVLSLRGLAAVLPPTFLPSGLCAAVLARGGARAAAGAGASSSGASGAGASGAGGHLAGTQGGGAVGAMSAAAGTGGAGGGWLVAGGSLGAKLTVGCLLALGVGAGCVALNAGSGHGRPPAPARESGRGFEMRGSMLGSATVYPLIGGYAGAPGSSAASQAGGGTLAGPHFAETGTAGREFGPERAVAGARAGSHGGSVARGAAVARGTSAFSDPIAMQTVRPSAASASARAWPSAGRQPPVAAAVRASLAEREFAPR